MALRRILRNQLSLLNSGKIQTARSGHGWDRPDVPLELNPLYVHRREVDIYDFHIDFKWETNRRSLYIIVPLYYLWNKDGGSIRNEIQS